MNEKNIASKDGRGDLGIIFIHSVLDEFGLDPYQFRVYARIARRASGGHGAYESIKNMALGCQMSEGKIKASLRFLLHHKLLSRESKSGTTSIYTLTPEREWVRPNAIENRSKRGKASNLDTIQPRTQHNPGRNMSTSQDVTCPPTQDVTCPQRISKEGNPVEVNPVKFSPSISPPEGEPEEREEKAFGFQMQEEVIQDIATGKPVEIIAQSSPSLKESSTTVDKTQDSSKRSVALATVRENGSQSSTFDPFYRRRAKPNEVQWDWVPDGAWKTEEGKLDEAFVMAIASKWAREYDGTPQDKKPNVIKHFRNEPTNLPIEWEWYQDNFFHKVANIQTRKANGLDTTADEAAVIKHIRAATPLDDSQRVTQAHKPSEVVQEVASYAIPVVEAIASVKNSIVKAAAIDTIVHQIMSGDKDGDDAIALEEAENKAAYQTTINKKDSDFWRQKHQQRMSMIETQPCDEAGSDELQKAKQFIESLKKRIQQSKSKLTALSEVISPVDNHAVILEDMRKRLNGTDEMRQEAINWACDPANGCQLVRDAKGRVIDIEEMDF